MNTKNPWKCLRYHCPAFFNRKFRPLIIETKPFWLLQHFGFWCIKYHIVLLEIKTNIQNKALSNIFHQCFLEFPEGNKMHLLSDFKKAPSKKLFYRPITYEQALVACKQSVCGVKEADNDLVYSLFKVISAFICRHLVIEISWTVVCHHSHVWSWLDCKQWFCARKRRSWIRRIGPCPQRLNHHYTIAQGHWLLSN